MIKKERFIKAARREVTDRVPVFANLTPQVAEILGKKFNLPYGIEDSFLSTRISHVEILNFLGNDAVGVGACRQKDRPTVDIGDGKSKDEWGMIYKKVGIYDEIVERPLANANSPEDIEKFSMPDPLDEARYEVAKRNIEKYSKEYAIVGDLEATIFELAWNLVGMEKFLMDMYCDEDYITVLLDKISDYNQIVGLKLIEMGSDMIWMGDDLGTQTGMMISANLYRRTIKPRQARIIKAFRSAKPDILIAYHSCGSILPIIEDLIEIGVDVLNPIQPLATGMNLAELKIKYGDRVAFFGTIDVQDVLPNGTVDDVRQEVQLRIKQGGKNSGLILAPAHNIQPDTPTENIIAMYDAIREFGKY